VVAEDAALRVHLLRSNWCEKYPLTTSALERVYPYLRHQQNIERGIERVGGAGGASTDPRQLPGVASLMLLPIEALSIKQHDDAMSVYMNARSFGSFEDEYTRTSALHEFQNYGVKIWSESG
jgi:hypothetical protein